MSKLGAIFFDSWGYVRMFWLVTGIALGAVLLVAALVGGLMAVDRAGCDQRNTVRPTEPMVWHWTTGCIAADPDAVVVVSS